MKLPVDIRFVGTEPSPAVEATIHARVAHIDRSCPEITAWRITVEQESRHQQQGRPFRVRVDVTLPGQELAVTRVHDEDVHIAVREALDAAHRRVEDAVRIRRGEVKQHSGPHPGAPD